MSRTSSSVQDYWIAGYGLSRHIVLRQIQFFLGPAATVRPYTHNGREGYLIHGTVLTEEQREDLKRQSREYERQQSIRMNSRAHSDGESDTLDINEPVILNHSRRSPGYSSYRPYR